MRVYKVVDDVETGPGMGLPIRTDSVEGRIRVNSGGFRAAVWAF